MEKVLQLYFMTAAGKKVMLTVDAPSADLVANDIEAAMEAIIQSGTFEIDASPLEAIHSARIVERSVTSVLEA